MPRISTQSFNLPCRMVFLPLAAVLLAFWTTGCGSTLSTETKLRIRIVGSLTKPTGATGTESPQAQVFLFDNISLKPDDGSASIDLYTGDPMEMRVVSRPQEVWSTTDLSDHVGKGFSSATIKFDPVVVVIDQGGSSHDLTLDSGDLVMSDPFEIIEGKETVITIRSSWGKTITPASDDVPGTTVSAPSFTLFLGENQ